MDENDGICQYFSVEIAHLISEGTRGAKTGGNKNRGPPGQPLLELNLGDLSRVIGTTLHYKNGVIGDFLRQRYPVEQLVYLWQQSRAVFLELFSAASVVWKRNPLQAFHLIKIDFQFSADRHDS